jgi:hypothetical protein
MTRLVDELLLRAELGQARGLEDVTGQGRGAHGRRFIPGPAERGPPPRFATVPKSLLEARGAFGSVCQHNALELLGGFSNVEHDASRRTAASIPRPERSARAEKFFSAAVAAVRV